MKTGKKIPDIKYFCSSLKRIIICPQKTMPNNISATLFSSDNLLFFSVN